MDTPGRRSTRSQMSTLGPSSGQKPQARGGGAGSAKKKDLPRAPFTDLTNDSPISGLMPAKLAASNGCAYECTPRSKLRPADRPIGEDLLRMQVTSLLRKVEAEALLHKKKVVSATPDMFESPMRLAAPTPANTPAAGVPATSAGAMEEIKAALLPPIVVASPIGHHPDVSSFTRISPDESRISPAFVSTAELLACLEETSPVEDGDLEPQSTTRTLKFDSPEKHLPGAEVETMIPTPPSVSTSEIMLSIEETSSLLENVTDGGVQEMTTLVLQFDSPATQVLPGKIQLSNRTIRFESPQKSVPDTEMVCELFSPSAHPHPRTTAAEDSEDSWSVIVNIHSPEKPEETEDHHQFIDVATTSEVDAETMEFIQNVLVDPEVTPLPKPPAVWERRDTPARHKSGLEEDDDDYEDCDEYDSHVDEDEDEEEEEVYGEYYEEACEELCKGISTISMGGEDAGVTPRGLPAFQGKHTRFNYNSDDEIEEDVVTDRRASSPSKPRLMGLPTPKGKHIRFSDDVDGEQND